MPLKLQHTRAKAAPSVQVYHHPSCSPLTLLLFLGFDVGGVHSQQMLKVLTLGGVVEGG